MQFLKVWYLYRIKYYSAIRKNEIVPFVRTWMDQQDSMLSEMSQRKGNTVMVSLICGI